MTLWEFPIFCAAPKKPSEIIKNGQLWCNRTRLTRLPATTVSRVGHHIWYFCSPGEQNQQTHEGNTCWAGTNLGQPCASALAGYKRSGAWMTCRRFSWRHPWKKWYSTNCSGWRSLRVRSNYAEKIEKSAMIQVGKNCSGTFWDHRNQETIALWPCKDLLYVDYTNVCTHRTHKLHDANSSAPTGTVPPLTGSAPSPSRPISCTSSSKAFLSQSRVLVTSVVFTGPHHQANQICSATDPIFIKICKVYHQTCSRSHKPNGFTTVRLSPPVSVDSPKASNRWDSVIPKYSWALESWLKQPRTVASYALKKMCPFGK